ncbi:hypothetical protein BDR05DRAFT_961352 [Suillus weaverae]|nr:hypothetical protein BDR05DRAFT_961352 [Suillus weaverae]
MTQSTSHPSSSYGSNLSSADMPNTGVSMGYQPVAPSPSVGHGVSHNLVPVQHDYYPSSVPRAAYVGPCPPLTAAAPPPQHPFAPLLYNQPFPSDSFPAATTPYAPHTLHQACLHQHNGAELAMGSASSFLLQAPSLSCGQKRVAEDLEDRNAKRIKMDSGGIPLSPETLAAEGTLPSYSAAYQGSSSSVSTSHVGVRTALFTFSLTTTSTRTPDSSLPETTLTETTEEATDSDSWTDNGVQDPAFVASQSQVQEITLAEIHRDCDIWRWINEIEDFEDPVLPISEPPSSLLPETILAEAAEDPDVWMLINEIEESIDLPPSESLTDAAQDPDFCNYPIRTLLICSWLNNCHEGLHERSPSELASFSTAHEM